MVVNYCYSWSSLQNPSFQSGNICRYCLLVVLICIAIQQSQMEMFALGMGSLVSRQCLRIWEHTDFPNQACPPEVLPPLRVGKGCQHPVVHLGMHTVHWCFCATLSTFAHALARSSRIRQSSSKCCFLLVRVCFAWFVGRYNNSPTCEALGKVMRSQYIGTVSSCISMSVNCDTASAPLMLAHLCHGAFLNVSNENSELLLSLHCTVSLTCLC